MKYAITLEFPNQKSLDEFREDLEEQEGDILIGYGEYIQVANSTNLVVRRVNAEHYILDEDREQMGA